MSVIVQKFGGTSLADTDKIKNVARAVVREKELGNDVIVVVSAMGHTTDNLIKLAHEITSRPSDREMDMLMSTGEQVSIALLTMAIQEMGYDAVSMTGAQVGILTEDTHSKARIVDIKTDKLEKHIEEGKIIIVAGFQGVTPKGEITTLGRGGSDTSAVAIAAAMKVDRCDIYSDVEGIYTTDPRVVPTAQKLKEISYIHSEAYAAGELKHGTISLVEEGTLVIAIATQQNLFEKLVSNIKEVKARGASVIAIAVEGSESIEKVADEVFYIPKTNELFSASATLVPMQLFAYYIAVQRGCDVDKPRNLAKSVTVE